MVHSHHQLLQLLVNLNIFGSFLCFIVDLKLYIFIKKWKTKRLVTHRLDRLYWFLYVTVSFWVQTTGLTLSNMRTITACTTHWLVHCCFQPFLHSVETSYCKIAYSLGSYSITPCPSLLYNKTGHPLREKTNVQICLSDMEARGKKNLPFWDNEWPFPQVTGAPMSWLTSQGQNETFCRPIYVIGGEPNDVVEGQWASGPQSSPQTRLLN